MDDALEHTPFPGRIVVVTITGDIMKNILQKTDTLMKLPMDE